MSLGVHQPGAEFAVGGPETVPAHAAWAADPASGGVD